MPSPKDDKSNDKIEKLSGDELREAIKNFDKHGKDKKHLQEASKEILERISPKKPSPESTLEKTASSQPEPEPRKKRQAVLTQKEEHDSKVTNTPESKENKEQEPAPEEPTASSRKKPKQ